MTKEEKRIQTDRMRYTKNKFSSRLVLLAIVFDALYFVSIYRSDVGSYYYSWVIGASIIYNLLFMLAAFLASEGVKNRRNGYTVMLTLLGVMQFARIFYIPMKAHGATVTVQSQELSVMSDGQFTLVVVCLAASGALCIAAAVTSAIQNRTLAAYMRSIENKPA